MRRLAEYHVSDVETVDIEIIQAGRAGGETDGFCFLLGTARYIEIDLS